MSGRTVIAAVQRRLSSRFHVEIGKAVSPAVGIWNHLLRDDAEGEPTDPDLLEFVRRCVAEAHTSSAQLMQDLLALHVTRDKRDGFFVEFGAADGKHLSNTYLLEKAFGWTGILAEPAQVWQDDLRANRTCIIDTRCVTDTSGDRILFNETASPELSTIDRLTNSDQHGPHRASGRRYEVETVSITDLLVAHRAPSTIDYLSVDTEGSEPEILASLDFTSFRPKLVSVEHNYRRNARSALARIMESKGYAHLWPELSRWDDWYVTK